MAREDRSTARWQPHPGERDLVLEHTGLAYGIARAYFIAGASDDDVRQEALIGLLVGIRSFQPELGSLRSFLQLAIHRWLQASIESGNRVKHRPLNESVREAWNEEGEYVAIAEMLPAASSDPVVLIEEREELARIAVIMKGLTALERRCLIDVAEGLTYKQIGGSRKSIDNAIQRARRKLRAA